MARNGNATHTSRVSSMDKNRSQLYSLSNQTRENLAKGWASTPPAR